ncbi:MAG: glutathione S-transferase family protein [Alphaproteobacteria bacterium]|nr:glutathione S-transferase family protein [Alphaproteobacteria bacterium]
MLKLYTARNSICTQKVFITLDEKSLAFDTEQVNLFTNEQYDPEYLKLNPKGVVPTLLHDGHAIVESTLICEYLDETYPQTALVPDDPYLRTQMRLWSKLIDEKIFEATREISFSAHFRQIMRKMTEEQREGRYRNVGDPERRDRMMSAYTKGVESHYVYQGVADFEKAFKSMEAALGPLGAGGLGGPWLLGEAFSLGDINMIPYVARMAFLNLADIWIADRPRVQAWWERAQARPSYKASISDQLTEEDAGEMWKYGSEIRDRVAELRADYLDAIHSSG